MRLKEYNEMVQFLRSSIESNPKGDRWLMFNFNWTLQNKIIWRWCSVLPRITPVYPLFNNWPLIDLDISRPLTGYTSSIFIPKEQFFIGNYFEFLVVLLHVSRVSLVFYFILFSCTHDQYLLVFILVQKWLTLSELEMGSYSINENIG